MRARKYTKVVEIWQTNEVADGYGGYTINETQVANSWANVVTIGNNKGVSSQLSELGITEGINSIIVNFRKRNDINYSEVNKFLKYRGEKYIIKAVTEINLEQTEIQIVATKETLKSIITDASVL